MPKKLSIAVIALIAYAILGSNDNGLMSILLPLGLLAGVLFRLKEAQFILKVLGHFFVLLLGYSATLEMITPAGGVVSAKLEVSSLVVGTELSLAIFSAVLILYMYSIHGAKVNDFFSRQIIPPSITARFSGNTMACYGAFIVFSASVYQSFQVKYENLQTTDYVNTVNASMSHFLAHYRLTPDEYSKFALTMIEQDKAQLEGIKPIAAEVMQEIEDALLKMDAVRGEIERRDNGG
ncbi:hypothetical protein [Oceanobacter kriegii]|uniref:hypothetical protein n=1 Tax=Oceanobacter kriegii TaxID=64972 RepID=UPI0004882AA9|nr:hypothetical protein [Oceanobacter kriegii]